MAETKSASALPISDSIDPILALAMADSNKAYNDNLLQSSVSNVVAASAQAAADNVEAGDALLKWDSVQLQNAIAYANENGNDQADQNAVTAAQVRCQTDQTIVSNNNQNGSNITQAGGTILSSLSQMQQQELQVFSQCIGSAYDTAVSNIAGWGS